MIAKMKALFDLFRKGSRISEPGIWRNRAALVGVLTPFLIALGGTAKAFGFDLGIDEDQWERAAHGIAALVPVFMAIILTITSRGVGLPEKKE
jgi:hypothetical protein